MFTAANDISANRDMQSDLHSKKVLIIDDEDILQDVLKEVMGMLEIPTVTANNGNQGIEIYKAQQKEIDLVLLDMMMPGLDGKETYQVLKRLNPQVKVIFMSGFTEEDTFFEEEGEGKTFIRKPFSIDEIRTKVLQMLA